MNTLDLFVTCSEGLEPLIVEELNELGIASTASYRGVFVQDSSWETIYKVNYCSRLASRVLFPLSQFRCYDRNSLYSNGSKIDWCSYIAPKATFSIDANVHHPQLRNSLFAAQVLKDAICDQIRSQRRERPNIETRDPDVQLSLFVHQNNATISLDTSGAPLHHRGYRQATTEAVLRESLAAALLRIAHFEPEDLLCDPCCGSGTILTEALLIASKTPPGYLRARWGFMNLPGFDQHDWLKVKAEIDALKTIPKAKVIGIDSDSEAIECTKRNLRAAGFQSYAELIQGDFRTVELKTPPTLVVTDPPYGKRTGETEELRQLYRSLGNFMKQKMAKPSRGYIFTGNLELAKEVGLAASRRYPVDNCGVDSRLLEFPIRA